METMRNMSFALTTAQLLDGTKTVTRRLGWKGLQPGDRFRAVRKAMGLRKGERVEALAECEVVSVRRESLAEIDAEDCAREGFPDLTPLDFVVMFAREMGCRLDAQVTRIEFRVQALAPR